jgi:hypothetical protein
MYVALHLLRESKAKDFAPSKVEAELRIQVPRNTILLEALTLIYSWSTPTVHINANSLSSLGGV